MINNERIKIYPNVEQYLKECTKKGYAARYRDIEVFVNKSNGAISKELKQLRIYGLLEEYEINSPISKRKIKFYSYVL